MRSYRRWTDDELRRATAMHERCGNYIEVGNAFGVTEHAIRSRIRGWRIRNRLPEPVDAARMRRRAIMDVLRAKWPDPRVTLCDLERETGIGSETLRRLAKQAKLGRKAVDPGHVRAASSRPPAPSGRGAKYNGRTYEDDPRDPPVRVPVAMQSRTMPGSWCGNAAAMCVEAR